VVTTLHRASFQGNEMAYVSEPRLHSFAADYRLLPGSTEGFPVLLRALATSLGVAALHREKPMRELKRDPV